MYTVYVLRSVSSGGLYTGQTEDFERRLFEHQEGLAGFTKNRGPWEVVYTEQYATRSEAMIREKFLKSGQGRMWLKERIDSFQS